MGNNLKNRVVNPGNEVATREPGIETQIAELESKFQAAMPRGAEASALVRDAMAVLRQNPKVGQCSPNSIKGALMTCAQLGLRPGIGALGQAHIVPFWNKDLVTVDPGSGRERRGGFEAQFIIGYQGMIELANRSGQIDLIVARTVYENDEFHIDYGTDTVHHIPAMEGRGKPRGYYAKFYRKDSRLATYEWMSVADAEAHRDKFAKQKNKQGEVWGPWKDHFDAMAKKSCVRMLFRWMPKSTQMQSAIVADESVRLDYETTEIDHSSQRVEPTQLVQGDYDLGADQETGEIPADDATPEHNGSEPTEAEKQAIYEQEMRESEEYRNSR